MQTTRTPGFSFLCAANARQARAVQNQSRAKSWKQKSWYDQKARHRVLLPGQKVMLLLSTSNSKLLAQWQCPFCMLRHVRPVTYDFPHPEKGKASQVYHINLLKEWKNRKCSADKTKNMDIESCKALTLTRESLFKLMPQVWGLEPS